MHKHDYTALDLLTPIKGKMRLTCRDCYTREGGYYTGWGDVTSDFILWAYHEGKLPTKMESEELDRLLPSMLESYTAREYPAHANYPDYPEEVRLQWPSYSVQSLFLK